MIMLTKLAPAQNCRAVGGCRPVLHKLLPLSEDDDDDYDDGDDDDGNDDDRGGD